MCLAVPMKVEKMMGPMAEVKAMGLLQNVDIQLVPKVKVGDYVLVHAGFAIQILDKNWAKESLELWETLN